ncbi:MAG: type I-C CRISPR-associated protein Cas5c [Suipraeoptans sp.]
MTHRNTVEFQVYGDLALFSDPVLRVGGEKTTYQIPTYEAIKGILHSIYWKPTFIWIVDEVRVINPIQTETKGIRPIKYNKNSNDLAYYTYLRNVKYQVRAHFEWNGNRPELESDRNENKHHNIAKRMIKSGGRRDVFLGTRECQAYVEPCVYGEENGYYDEYGEVSYGLTYHGITYADEAINDADKGQMTVRFWKPVMRNGIIEYIRPENCIDIKHIKKMDIKVFDENNFIGLNEFGEEEDFELD